MDDLTTSVPPIKLTVPGRFWDSQIYAGYMYLFGIGGDLTVINWDRAIDELRVPDELKLSVSIAFVESELLYSRLALLVARDPELQPVILKKFERLSQLNLTFNGSHQLAGATQQDNPLPFPHNDSEIHYRELYVAARSGVFSVPCNLSSQEILKQDISKLWDAPTFDLAADHKVLAMAAGSDGLFELDVRVSDLENYPSQMLQPKSVTQQNCTQCEWVYFSLYGSSHKSAGFLASFKKVPPNGEQYANSRIIQHVADVPALRSNSLTVGPDPDQKKQRVLEGIESSTQIFQQTNNYRHGYSWGGHDKLYRYHDGVIDVIKYNPNAQNQRNKYSNLGQIYLEAWKGDVVSASVVPFGVVIECDNAMIILPSIGKSLTIPGEPVNWRVFPRSVNYRNQLHIIYDDRLEIWSFNHDYSASQRTKQAGTQVDTALKIERSLESNLRRKH